MKITLKRTLTLLIAICVLIACCLIPSYSTNDAYAGLLSMDVWNKDMYEAGFKSVSYKGGVDVKEGKITFTKSCSPKAQAVSQYKLYDMKDKVRKCGFTAGLTITVGDNEDSVKGLFGLAFGLQTSNTEIASKNSVFVYIQETVDGNDKALSLGVKVYDQKGNKSDCITPIDIEELFSTDRQRTFRLGVIVDENGGIKILIDDFVLTEKSDAGLDFAGYVGLGQTAVNEWSVENFIVTGISNYAPRTTDITEDFYNDEFNVNQLYTYAYVNYADDCYLKPIDGRMQFKNVSTAYMSTQYQYSNYELTFDLCDIQREPEYDQNFKVLTPVSNKIGITLYSSDAKTHTSKGVFMELRPENWTNTSSAESTKVVIVKDGVELYSETLSGQFHLWDKSFNGKVFNVKITLTDGVVTLFLKLSNNVGYEQAFTFDLGGASQGYVKLYASGTSKSMQVESDFSESLVSTFSIDNFAISNNDYENTADVIVDFKSNKNPGMDHYDYVDTWDDSDLLFGRG